MRDPPLIHIAHKRVQTKVPHQISAHASHYTPRHSAWHGSQPFSRFERAKRHALQQASMCIDNVPEPKTMHCLASVCIAPVAHVWIHAKALLFSSDHGVHHCSSLTAWHGIRPFGRAEVLHMQ